MSSNPVGRLGRRASESWRVVQTEGGRALAQRLARAGSRRLGAAQADFSLLPGDVADSQNLALALPDTRPALDQPLTIGWINTPPSAGSGGHTTTFRLIEAMEQAGHTCVIYLYDRYLGDTARHEAVIRRHWPALRAEVRAVRDGLQPTDALVATSWPTAHALAVHGTAPTRRLYLVQDFEPYFYPRGSEYALAEDTYRFGFRPIAIGNMVADVLRAEVGVEAVVAEFGCDTDVYRFVNRDRRNGVVFYAKPEVARRGFQVGALALEEFHRRHPEVEIHLFGDPAPSLRFPATHHGVLAPAALSDLFNTCTAGLALSFTNISLSAEEMLACGTIPIVNDSPLARADLANPFVGWGFPTPDGLADALSRAVEATDQVTRAAAAAQSVRGDTWKPAQQVAVTTIETEVYGEPRPR
jgi:O-antigen biosynthesis protein